MLCFPLVFDFPFKQKFGAPKGYNSLRVSESIIALDLISVILPKSVVHFQITVCRILPREVYSHDLTYELFAKLGIVPEVDSRARTLLKLVFVISRKGESVTLDLVSVEPKALYGVVESARLANHGYCTVARRDHLRESAGLALRGHHEYITCGV